ncbi:MAG: single-stranded DNA-binding protein [Bacteroidota bacterium]
MSGVNKVILLGNLGRDPETKHLENGRARTNFTLATNETYKNREGAKVTNTEWHNVVLWTPIAEIAEQYLSKGKQVYIEGKLTSRSYVDREGQTKHITEVVGQNLMMLGGKGEEVDGQSERPQPPTSHPLVDAEPTDGLPF